MAGESGSKQEEDLIVIDSDEEDEVIFVEEDGGRTLAQSETVVAPGFLENLPLTNQPEVRSLFDNVVKISSDLETNPIIIERTFSVSPSQEFDEDQMELPNYNVQFFNKSYDSDSISSVPRETEPEVPETDITEDSNPNELTKPVIKLAPLSKLLDQPNFVSLDQIVNNLGVNTPQINIQKKPRKKRQEKDIPSEVGPSKPKKYVYKSPPQINVKNELREKMETLQKYIPGYTGEQWPREQIVRKVIDFIMELRRSDCELDIAEEALIQTNIKLTMDYDSILEKVYSLCPRDNSEPEMSEVSTPRRSRHANEEQAVKPEEPKVKEECTSLNSSQLNYSSDSSVQSPNEDCLLLKDLLGEVKESAKSHLLNFDPDVPFDDFLPPTLLNWERPKSKTDILDEIMYLENAISKCSDESEEIRKLSHQQEIFKYEDLIDTFKKEFDLEVSKSIREMVVKDEVNVDEDLLEPSEEELKEEETVQNETECETNEVPPVKLVIKPVQNLESPKKFKKKRRPWNKGLKGYKKIKNALETLMKDKDDVSLDLDNEAGSPMDNSIQSDSEELVQVKQDVPQKLSEGIEPVVVDETKKKSKKVKKGRHWRKKLAKKLKAKKQALIEGSTKVAQQPLSTDSDEVKVENSVKSTEEDEVDEIPLDKLKKQLSVKLIRENIEDLVAKSLQLPQSVEPAQVDDHETEGFINNEDAVPEESLPQVKEPKKKVVKSKKIKKQVTPTKILVTSPDPLSPEEPKRRKSLRPKFAEGARTTRSFVKKCSEVMDHIDKEMRVFLRKDKRIDIDILAPIEDDESDDDSKARDNHQIDNKETEEHNEAEENNSDPDKKNEIDDKVRKHDVEELKNSKQLDNSEVNETKVLDKKTEIDQSEKKQDQTEEEEDVDIDSIAEEDLSLTPDESLQLQAPISKKKKKKYFTGKSRRRPKKSKSKAKQEPAPEEPTDQNPVKFDNNVANETIATPIEESTNTNVASEKDINEKEVMNDARAEDLTDSVNESSGQEVKGGRIEDMTSNVESKLDSDVKEKEVDAIKEPILVAASSSKLLQNNDNPLAEAPLDFSLKATHKSPDKTVTNVLPLNLSNKTESDCVIDFSLKKPVDNVKVDDKVFSNSFNSTSFPSPSIDTPKTPFTSGKQIFSDPKDFNIAPVVTPSAPVPLPLTLQSNEIDQSVAPVKDNIINEITDILADLAEDNRATDLNYEMGGSSTNKTPSSAPQIPLLSEDDIVPTNLSNVRTDVAYSNPVENSVSSTSSNQGRNFAVISPNQYSSNDIRHNTNFPVNSQRCSNVMQTPQIPNYCSSSQLALYNQSNLGQNMGKQAQATVYVDNRQMRNPDQTQMYHSNVQFNQTSNEIVPYNSVGTSKMDQAVSNINDPRLTRQFSQEPSSEDKQIVSYGSVAVRDPRIARKIMAERADSPFSGNLQITQIINEVIKQNNFENFLMDSKGGQMIMNQNLEIDEEDLNLNRSDFDDFASDSDELANEDKQRQCLLRKSIDKLIVTDLKDPAQALKEAAKKDSDSSDESIEDSSFNRRVIRSPPMVRKKYNKREEYIEEEVMSRRMRQRMQVESTEMNLYDRKPLRRSRTSINYTENDSDENSNSNVSSECFTDDCSKSKRKLSVKEYMKRNKPKSQKNEEELKPASRESDDEDSIKTKKKSKKRVIDSDEEYDDLSHDGLEKQNDDDESKGDEEKSELSDDVTDHLKRVSDIKHRKLQGNERKVLPSKREPLVRRTKFLDELPDTDVASGKELIPPISRRYPDKLSPKYEKHVTHKRDESPKSTRVVRKTITTERIVTKRIAGDTSPKKVKLLPEKEKKVYVQERITLKVNERSNLDRKGGMNFKCDALKEGEILKVVNGKLVRVRKRLSNSDEEIERERSKLHRCLSSFKIKKKSDKNSPVDDNPYSVLKDDVKAPEPLSQTYQDPKLTSPPVKPLLTMPESVKKPAALSRSNSIDSAEEVKRSPVGPRLVDPRRFNRPDGMSPKISSPGNLSISPRISSSPSMVYPEATGLLRRPSIDVTPIVHEPPFNPSNQVALKPNMEMMNKPAIELVTDTGMMKANQDWQYSQLGDGMVMRKTNMEVARRPDMDVTCRSDFEVARSSNVEVANSSNFEVAKRSDMEMSRSCDMEMTRAHESNVARQTSHTGQNEMFTRREVFQSVERRRPRDIGFAKKEFSRDPREKTSVREWNRDKKQDRSILEMFQRGEIRIWESSTTCVEERSWNTESRNVFDQRRNESGPSRDPRKVSNISNESDLYDSGDWDWRERIPHPRDDSTSWNARDERSYRGHNDERQFHQRNDERIHRNQNNSRSFRGLNDKRPFNQDDRYRDHDERSQYRDRDDRPHFRDRNERQQYHDDDERYFQDDDRSYRDTDDRAYYDHEDRLSGQDYDNRSQYRDRDDRPYRRDDQSQSRRNDSYRRDRQQDRQPKRFSRDSDQFREDQDYQRNRPEPKAGSSFSDSLVSPMQDLRPENPKPPSLLSLKTAPAHPPAFSTRPSWF